MTSNVTLIVLITLLSLKWTKKKNTVLLLLLSLPSVPELVTMLLLGTTPSINVFVTELVELDYLITPASYVVETLIPPLLILIKLTVFVPLILITLIKLPLCVKLNLLVTKLELLSMPIKELVNVLPLTTLSKTMLLVKLA